VDFPSTLKQFSRFETLEEFRNIYSRIGKPSDIPDSNMFLFREGVEPLWEVRKRRFTSNLLLTKEKKCKYFTAI